LLCLTHGFPSGSEAARLKINEEFKRNKNEASEENIKEVNKSHESQMLFR